MKTDATPPLLLLIQLLEPLRPRCYRRLKMVCHRSHHLALVTVLQSAHNTRWRWWWWWWWRVPVSHSLLTNYYVPDCREGAISITVVRPSVRSWLTLSQILKILKKHCLLLNWHSNRNVSQSNSYKTKSWKTREKIDLLKHGVDITNHQC